MVIFWCVMLNFCRIYSADAWIWKFIDLYFVLVEFSIASIKISLLFYKYMLVGKPKKLN